MANTSSRPLGDARGLARVFVRFFVGAILITALGLGARLGLVAFLGDSLYGLPELQMERMAKVFGEPEVARSRLLILGDSTATFSLMARKFPDTVSLATINSTAIETFYTLKHALEAGAHPACALFSASFTWGANHDYFWPMFVYGGFYSDAELDEIFRVSSANGDPPGVGGRWEFRARKFLYGKGVLDGFSIKRIQEGLVDYRGRQRHVSGFREFIRREAGSNPLLSHVTFEGRTELTFDGAPAMNVTEREYFARFLDLLERNRIRLYILELPFAESVPRERTEEHWRGAEALIAGSRPRKPPVFVRIAPAPLPADMYLSAGHLDRRGVDRIAPGVRQALSPCFAAQGSP